jgi:hypothetical protein
MHHRRLSVGEQWPGKLRRRMRMPQLFVKEVEKVALSDLRVIGGKGGGVYLASCKNASLSGKSIIRGNQHTGLYAYRTQLTVEKAEFQDNGKASTPDKLLLPNPCGRCF